MIFILFLFLVSIAKVVAKLPTIVLWCRKKISTVLQVTFPCFSLLRMIATILVCVGDSVEDFGVDIVMDRE